MAQTEVKVSRQHYVVSNIWRNLSLKIDLLVGWWMTQPEDRIFVRCARFIHALWANTAGRFLRPDENNPPSNPHRSLRPDGDSILSALADVVRLKRHQFKYEKQTYFDDCELLFREFFKRIEYKQIDRLSEQDTADMIYHSARNKSYVGRVCKRDLFLTDTIFELTDRQLYFKEKGAKFLYECIMKNRGEIRTVLNIGARIDSGAYFLARKFPDITFISLDFQTNLRWQNAMAFSDIPPNWMFLSGYALDMFAAGLSADLVFTQATTVAIGSKELDHYFGYFHKNGVKYVALQESWYPRTKDWRFWRLMKPEDIGPDFPCLSGSIGTFHHNFIGKLDRNNFEVLTSVLRDDHETGDYYVYQLLAKNNLPVKAPKQSSPECSFTTAFSGE